MLHIMNGDASLAVFRQTGIPGDSIAWQEALMEGPIRNHKNLADFWDDRGAYLERYGLPKTNYVAGKANFMKTIEKYDEILLWFEFDLFCQANLMFLVSMLSDIRKSLFLICPESYPGKEIFRGLGELVPGEFATLLETKIKIGEETARYFNMAWLAYTAPDPGGIIKLAAEPTSPFPILQKALKVHLERFPSSSNGINILEDAVMKEVIAGNDTFTGLFGKITFERKFIGYGMGDVQFLGCLQKMGRGERPLVRLAGFEGIRYLINGPQPDFSKCRVSVAETGKEVLAGKTDWIETNGIEEWLGGVHLSGNKCSRWNGRQILKIPKGPLASGFKLMESD